MPYFAPHYRAGWHKMMGNFWITVNECEVARHACICPTSPSFSHVTRNRQLFAISSLSFWSNQESRDSEEAPNLTSSVGSIPTLQWKSVVILQSFIGLLDEAATQRLQKKGAELWQHNRGRSTGHEQTCLAVSYSHTAIGRWSVVLCEPSHTVLSNVFSPCRLSLKVAS